MPLEVVPVGIPFTTAQNKVYALPSFPVSVYTDSPAPAIQQSMTANFLTNTAVTLTEGQSPILTGSFIRTTAAGITLVFKRRS